MKTNKIDLIRRNCNKIFCNVLCWIFDWSVSPICTDDNLSVTLFAPILSLWDLFFWFIQWFASEQNKNLVIVSGKEVCTIDHKPSNTSTLTLVLQLPFAAVATSPKQTKFSGTVCFNYDPQVRSILVGTSQEFFQVASYHENLMFFVRIDWMRVIAIFMSLHYISNFWYAMTILTLAQTNYSNCIYSAILSLIDPQFSWLYIGITMNLCVRCIAKKQYRMSIAMACSLELVHFFLKV